MKQIVIYRQPRDFPKEYVAREWFVEAGGTLRAGEIVARDFAPEPLRAVARRQGLCPVARDPSDDPSILETWI